MKLYEIIGNSDSEFAKITFGHFTTKELAEAGYQALPEEFQDETRLSLSNLSINTIETNDNVIDLTAKKTTEEIIASKDENNYVEGYIEIDMSVLIDNDFEGFLDIISEELVGSDLLMDTTYEIVGFEEGNMLILKIRGDVSNIIDAEEEDEQ